MSEESKKMSITVCRRSCPVITIDDFCRWWRREEASRPPHLKLTTVASGEAVGGSEAVKNFVSSSPVYGPSLASLASRPPHSYCWDLTPLVIMIIPYLSAFVNVYSSFFLLSSLPVSCFLSFGHRNNLRRPFPSLIFSFSFISYFLFIFFGLLFLTYFSFSYPLLSSSFPFPFRVPPHAPLLLTPPPVAWWWRQRSLVWPPV